MRRTLLPVGFAVLVSMLFVPCHKFGFWGWYGPQPFWIATDTMTAYEWRYMWPKLILQTVFLAVLFAVIVNIRWRRKPKTGA
jgi:TRAP-type C4-dicarboxylate transport system permease small subunit